MKAIERAVDLLQTYAAIATNSGQASERLKVAAALRAILAAPEPAEARDAQDAARYRWLREHGRVWLLEDDAWIEYPGARSLDAAIDAAMGERK